MMGSIQNSKLWKCMNQLPPTASSVFRPTFSEWSNAKIHCSTPSRVIHRMKKFQMISTGVKGCDSDVLTSFLLSLFVYMQHEESTLCFLFQPHKCNQLQLVNLSIKIIQLQHWFCIEGLAGQDHVLPFPFRESSGSGTPKLSGVPSAQFCTVRVRVLNVWNSQPFELFALSNGAMMEAWSKTCATSCVSEHGPWHGHSR